MCLFALAVSVAASATIIKMPSATARFSAAIVGSAAAAPAPRGRTFYPFVATVHCNNTQLMAEYSAHSSNISGIILYAYGPSENGLLTPNSGAAHGHDFPPRICEDNYAKWKEIAPIYAAIGGTNVGPALTNASMEQRFIASAVSKAVEFGLSGFNYDIEGSASGPRELLPFFTRFADALHVHNMTLTSCVDGCPHGSEGISCAEYQASSLDGVVLMSWYKAEPVQRFLDKVTNTTKAGSLGAPKTMAGWSGSHWMSNCTVMDFVLSQGITSIGWWSGSLRGELNWALLHEFLTVDPTNPPAPATRYCKTAGYTPMPPPPGPNPDPEVPFKITRGELCLSASGRALPSNATLRPCNGEWDEWKFSDGGICRGWSGDGVGIPTLTGREANAALCLVVHAWDTPAKCDAGQELGLGRVRDGEHLFTLDNVTGTLRSNNCAGRCAATTDGGGLMLEACDSAEASGFHSSWV